ncbi:MAG: hypothetical protein M1814_002646 [Vezdaea aestivalis]|nr:MAG: hypothetical protein M1814_002646 [Vezdaea aestivalis]
MAHATLQSLAPSYPSLGLIDSCGIGAYHTSSPPDERTTAVLEAHGIKDFQHGARKLRAADFKDFDYVLAMDRTNLRDCQRVREQVPGAKASLMLFGDFAGDGRKGEIVADPYYGGNEGFEMAFEQCMRFSRNFVKETVEGGK